MTEKARAIVVERGKEDWDSEFARFPRLFEGHEDIPGLTWPTTTFHGRMSVYLGDRRVDIMQLGRAHTAGDAVIYVPDANVIFTGDIVEYDSACYCDDGHFHDRPDTLEKIRARDLDAIAPGRGDALAGGEMVNAALDSTSDFVTSTYRSVVALRGGSLKEAIRNSLISRSMNIACPSTSHELVMRHATSTPRASGPPSATRRCGRPSRAEGGRNECRRAGRIQPGFQALSIQTLARPGCTNARSDIPSW